MSKTLNAQPGRTLWNPAIAVGLVVLAGLTTTANAERLILTGVSAEFGDRVNRSMDSPLGGPAAGFNIDELCAASPMIGDAMNRLLDTIDSEAARAGAPVTLSQIESMPGVPSRFDIANDLANARDALCTNPDPQTSVQPFTITYSRCEMSMQTPTHTMVIILEDDDTARMLIADHPAREVLHKELTSHIDRVSEYVGSGWSDGIRMVSQNQTARIFGYDTELYRFEYTTGLGDAGIGAASAADVEAGRIDSVSRLGNLVSVTTEGSAWVSSNAPGIDIARTFYRNFASRIQPDESTSFFGGLIQNLVGMLDRGLPIVIEQTISSRVMGRTSVSGRSESHVANIRVVQGDMCGGVQIPSDYSVTDVDAQMSAAAGGSAATGGYDGASEAELQEAMRQANEAMQQMTPEQRQMMESLGLGSMMPGAMGGGGAPDRSQPARPSAPAPSSALQSGDLTTSVQRHLQALGYEVDNTHGTLSLETQIAISTFQAERGLEVTGEVTPALLGVLAVEVDRQNGN